MRFGRVIAVARKETIQLRRDVRSLLLAFFIPMALLLFFGFAISFDVTNIEMVVVDHSRSARSRALIDAFARSGYFQVAGHAEGYADGERWLDRGAARLVLVIPPDFAHDSPAGVPAGIQILLDGADAYTATIARSYSDAIIAGYGADLTRETSRSMAPVIRAEARIWFNETLESVNMIVPGLIAVIMSIIAAMLTALTIAREWERGTMEQLASTPVGRWEIVLGKLLPYVGIGVVDVTMAVLVGVIVFEVPLRGNVLLLAATTVLFLTGALGFGMFISAALKSQVLATQVAMVATYLPALLLSGFMFSIANMPAPLRILTLLVPARYFITVTRGIFLKGVGLPVLWLHVLAMVVFAAVGLGLATHLFRKEIA